MITDEDRKLVFQFQARQKNGGTLPYSFAHGWCDSHAIALGLEELLREDPDGSKGLRLVFEVHEHPEAPDRPYPGTGEFQGPRGAPSKPLFRSRGPFGRTVIAIAKLDDGDLWYPHGEEQPDAHRFRFCGENDDPCGSTSNTLETATPEFLGRAIARLAMTMEHEKRRYGCESPWIFRRIDNPKDPSYPGPGRKDDEP